MTWSKEPTRKLVDPELEERISLWKSPIQGKDVDICQGPPGLFPSRIGPNTHNPRPLSSSSSWVRVISSGCAGSHCFLLWSVFSDDQASKSRCRVFQIRTTFKGSIDGQLILMV